MADININGFAEELNEKADLVYVDNEISIVDTSAVHKANDETISGIKTFSKSPEFPAGINLKATGITKGTVPTANQYWGIRANDKTSPGSSWQNTRLGVLEWCTTTANVNQVSLIAYNNAADSSAGAQLTLAYTGDGPRISIPGDITAGGKKIAAWVTETYKSGTSWYRKYSDGWIEQGGRFSWSDNGQKGPINLLKTMADTNYSVQVRVVGTSADGSDTANVRDISTASFYISAYSSSRTIMWEVKGFAA